MIIHSERTALSKSIPNAPLRKFIQWTYRNRRDFGGFRALDYGCGHVRDEKIYDDNFMHTTFYDPYWNKEIPKNYVHGCSYNVIICTYVLNVVPPKEREKILNFFKIQLDGLAYLFLAVRHSSKEKPGKKWVKYEDGYITTRETFQKFFTDHDIYRMFKKYTIDEIEKGVYVIWKELID